MKRWEESGWGEEDLSKLELSFLHGVFQCSDSEGVDGSLTFARYMNKVGVNPDNYPMFLKIIMMRNHWVVDGLIGDRDPETFFGNIQPNYYFLKACFEAFTNAKRGGIYPKSLLVFIGILNVTYENPLEGYRVYSVTPEDLNNLGKHLDETQDQKYPLNRSILKILDRIASLYDPGNPPDDPAIAAAATQANNMRGKFLDMTKSLKESIPDLLLQTDDYTQNEVQPSITR